MRWTFQGTYGRLRRGYGIVTSSDQGASWQGGPVMGEGDLSVSDRAWRHDGCGARRRRCDLNGCGAKVVADGVPTMLTRIHRVVFSPDGTLWLGAREGVY